MSTTPTDQELRTHDSDASDGTEPTGWPTQPRGATSRLSSAPAILVSMLVTGGLLTLLLLRNPRYFFIDDRIAETVPKLMDIGRLLTSGEPPWLSTNIINGGGYAVEYLNGVFNPLNLALSVVLSRFDDAALGSFVYVLAHCLLLAGSAAWLGRLLGLNSAWAVTFGVSCGFQPYTVVWNTTAWSQGLLAFSWFMLTVAAVVAFHLRGQRRYGWGVLLGTYGTLTSGWPLTVFILGCFVAALVVARLLARCASRRTYWLAAWFAGGIACSLVAVVPLLTSFDVAARSSSISNSRNFNVATLEGLLHAANPAYQGFFYNFDGYLLQSLPHYYAAWFVLPVLAFVRPRRLSGPLAPVAAAAAVLLAVSALSALGPERLLVFRFPTRSLQFSSFFLVMLVVLLVVHGSFLFSRRRLLTALGVAAVLLLNSLQADPQGLRRVVVFGMALLGLTALVWWAGAHSATGLRRRGLLPGVDLLVLLATVAILALVTAPYPTGRGEDFGFPQDLRGLQPRSRADYTLYYGTVIPDDSPRAAFAAYRQATTGLMIGDRQLNGYSSLGNRFLRKSFDIDDQGNFTPGGADGFTRREPTTGRQVLELFRVDQIIALRGAFDDELRSSLGPGWDRVAEGPYTATYQHASYQLPGLVSAVSPGLTASRAADCPVTAARECVALAVPAGGGQLTFARLWLPGYAATLAGRELAPGPGPGGLVTVTVPPGVSGRFVLTYAPPGLRPLTGLALLVLVLLAGASARYGRQGSRREVTRKSAAEPT